jgi:hypothetical protein
LKSLLGDVRFVGVLWSTILAIAFCAIDFAGLVRIFTPERGREEPKAVWFLLGAWFLGTIANAIMTWWAVSLTLLNHDFGNEVLSREQLLRYVPIFVAALVWLTRILFIGAFSVAGEDVFERRRPANGGGGGGKAQPKPNIVQQTPQPTARPMPAQAAPKPAANNSQPRQTVKPQPAPARQAPPPRPAAPPPRPAATPSAPIAPQVTYEPVDDPVVAPTPPPVSNQSSNMPQRPESRIRQRPPMPGAQVRYPTSTNVQAQSRDDAFRQL